MECSPQTCVRCYLRDWCDHRMDAKAQDLIQRVIALHDPKFIVR